MRLEDERKVKDFRGGIILGLLTILLVLGLAGFVNANSNTPEEKIQCNGEKSEGFYGFVSQGFSKAEQLYSDAIHFSDKNKIAVSQYDMACIKLDKKS